MLHHEKGATPPLFASGYCTPPSPAGSRKPARKAACRAGFTLLEMLVVIAVMALLMGVTFRMMQPSDRARRVANTIKTLNLVNAAIAEYHAEYGIYPPVTDPPVQRLVGGNLVVDSDADGAIPGVAVGYFAPTVNSLANTKSILDIGPGEDDPVFVFGLASFLVDRCDPEMKGVDKDGKPTGYDGGSFLDNIFGKTRRSQYFGAGSHWAEFGMEWNKDWSDSASIYDRLAASGKDANFYRRIRGITRKFIEGKGSMNAKEKSLNYNYYTIRDSCVDDGQDLVYICPPPFNTYAIFSAGPDGKVVTDDPLNPEAKCSKCGEYHNRDNIYSTVNVK